MKAIVIEKFGGAEELKLRDVAAPVAGPGELLIKVSHAGVNPVDYKIREGYLKEMMPHRFPVIMGWDVAGTVAVLGEGVRGFEPGDRVYAYARKPDVSLGTYAELIAVQAANAAPVPASLSDAQAAALPLAGLTAWQSLHDFAGLERGQTVLVHAGAGGVGSYAIQLAKAAGATVVTTASAAKHAYVKSLGADYAIDYTAADVAAELAKLFPEGVDVVMDCVGGETLVKSFPLVKRGGVVVSIVDTPSEALAIEHGVKAGFVFVSPSGSGLRELGRLVTSGALRAPEVEVLPLADAALAHRKSESRRTVGKIVLAV